MICKNAFYKKYERQSIFHRRIKSKALISIISSVKIQMKKNLIAKIIFVLASTLLQTSCAQFTALIVPTPTPVPVPTITPRPSATIAPTNTAAPSSSPTVPQTLTPIRTPTKNTLLANCAIAAPPPELKVEGFYKKFCSALGLPVLSSASVPDLALAQAAVIVVKMVSARSDVRAKLIEKGVRVGIMGAKEVTTDLPEYRNLYTQFPGTDWNKRTRGVGATSFIPLSSGAEENLLCYSSDPYRGENIFLHEFSHTIKVMGLRFLDPGFDQRVKNAYDAAIAAGLWKNTYAASNVEEYWAEGVQDYFNANLESNPPNGVHNHVNTRAELAAYDPKLHEIIAGIFPGPEWSPGCP